MDQYILLITIFGFAAFAMAWMPTLTKKTGISYSIFYVLAGILVYLIFPASLPKPLPQIYPTATLRLSELVVIISLMGTGIKIDRVFSFKNWSSPLRLIFVAMIGCIAAAAFLGYAFLGLSVASAVLLGSVLAPTDPVLASDVQVGPPNEKIRSETKFTLTAEAGLNDGMAFPFTWLAIILALMAAGSDESLWHWFSYYLLYKLAAGVVIGIVLGRLAGYLIFKLSKRLKFLDSIDGFIAVAFTLVVYGITEMAHAYGFIAVFVSAITLRHYEKEHDLHEDLHTFTDQAERLLVAVVLILFGGSLVSGLLDVLTWKMVIFSFVFLLIVRPVIAFVSLMKVEFHVKEKIAISFFGIRGLGSIYYLAFALQKAKFEHSDELWAIVTFTILVSVLIHGFTANSIMRHLKQVIPKERIPE